MEEPEKKEEEVAVAAADRSCFAIYFRDEFFFLSFSSPRPCLSHFESYCCQSIVDLIRNIKRIVFFFFFFCRYLYSALLSFLFISCFYLYLTLFSLVFCSVR